MLLEKVVEEIGYDLTFNGSHSASLQVSTRAMYTAGDESLQSRPPTHGVSSDFENITGFKALGCKWIFKTKLKTDGSIDKYKARLVVQGFRQKEGLDFFDTYSPVTRITSIRMLISIVALRDLEIHQMDVKTAFLNGELEEEIYMKQPEGFVVPRQELSSHCMILNKLQNNGMKVTFDHDFYVLMFDHYHGLVSLSQQIIVGPSILF